MIALIVHGGAGRFSGERHDDARQACANAFTIGHDVLHNNGSALDAVEAAVRALEDAPVLNAGTGSQPDQSGAVAMDAIIVNGATLDFGAVSAIRNVAHPISVARKVMETTKHCMLTADGATQFARDQGFPYVSDDELRGAARSELSDTVGAVAIDANGHVAAATSTGGTRNKMPGRVGDSPLIGCGAIAEDGVGAVSATGHGESLMKIMMARTTLEFLREGHNAMDAAQHAVAVLADRTSGEGGVIIVDANGNTGFAHNTAHMARAYFRDDEPIAEL